jgi:hypothetical protein
MVADCGLSGWHLSCDRDFDRGEHEACRQSLIGVARGRSVDSFSPAVSAGDRLDPAQR